jgi:hypothetical protein
MRTYILVSAIFFAILTAVQLIRFLLGWPVVVAGVSVPVWVSALAAIVVGSLAAWGMRLVLKGRLPSVNGQGV